MICRHCGTDLPEDALFCGECGRAVLIDSLVGVGSAAGSVSSGIPETYAQFAPTGTAAFNDGEHGMADPSFADELLCPQCGTIVEDSDVFCGECGFVLSAGIPEPAHESEPDPDPEPEAEPEADPEPEPEAEPSPTGRKDPIVADKNETEVVSQAGRARTIPDPFPWGADFEDGEDIEATRVVSQNGNGERFVLQFSTGESVTVSGAGLIGRNPAAQPGEYVDQLVSIFDVGKSVSKTHLEFGQEGGRFWVSDRYSTNGSVVRQPEAEQRRCEPGRRYFVMRGTRIDVGEQFFVVS